MLANVVDLTLYQRDTLISAEKEEMCRSPCSEATFLGLPTHHLHSSPFLALFTWMKEEEEGANFSLFHIAECIYRKHRAIKNQKVLYATSLVSLINCQAIVGSIAWESRSAGRRLKLLSRWLGPPWQWYFHGSSTRSSSCFHGGSGCRRSQRYHWCIATRRGRSEGGASEDGGD